MDRVGVVFSLLALLAVVSANDKCVILGKQPAKQLGVCSHLRYETAFPVKGDVTKSVKYADTLISKYTKGWAQYRKNDPKCQEALKVFGCVLALPRCNVHGGGFGVCEETCAALMGACFDKSTAYDMEMRHCRGRGEDRSYCSHAKLYLKREGALPIPAITGVAEVKPIGRLRYGASDFIVTQLSGKLSLDGGVDKLVFSISDLVGQGAADYWVSTDLLSDDGRLAFLMGGKLGGEVQIIEGKNGFDTLKAKSFKYDAKVKVNFFDTPLAAAKTWLANHFAKELLGQTKDMVEGLIKKAMEEHISKQLTGLVATQSNLDKTTVHFKGDLDLRQKNAALGNDMVVSFLAIESSHDIPLFDDNVMSVDTL